MAKRVDDWLRQADRDLRHARNSLRNKEYEWACFASQQSAEKALKALYQHLGGEAFGHSLLKMIKDLPARIRPKSELFRIASELDKFYIPTRYPNGFDWGAPMDYFGKKDASDAIRYASTIIKYVKKQISK
ncbi:DNA-binding protein [candidate division WOR-3 bacterium 4484_100]|uniref:DNA-binding protein n=1 Tax=candidate division WOR-3 bacterium 4484_100 TaxID=1936077 RepID=A0A1V4QES7_UNCW3|nr:MAG: DNA-binding protein [candidate division WOR-3 bacterium 4484_100]